MKFPLSWLKTHLQTEASVDVIAAALTNIGLELEGVENRGAALAPFVIAHVVEAVQHPNADRLRACKVDTGGGLVSVVCGAPNARTGMKGVFAPPGSFIPGKGVTLKVGEIRGVQSAGMLPSTKNTVPWSFMKRLRANFNTLGLPLSSNSCAASAASRPPSMA